MHGIIFVQLKKFVETQVSTEAWRDLLVRSGVPGKMYMAVRPYEDSELGTLVQNASAMTGTPAPVLLRAFGAFIVPDLMKTYRSFMKNEWRTLEVLEFTETHIHTQVRAMTKGAMPPFLNCKRTGPNEVLIQYKSARKLCPVAEGIIEGIATHYGEKVTIAHETCMNKGAPECTLRVRRAA